MDDTLKNIMLSEESRHKGIPLLSVSSHTTYGKEISQTIQIYIKRSDQWLPEIWGREKRQFITKAQKETLGEKKKPIRGNMINSVPCTILSALVKYFSKSQALVLVNNNRSNNDKQVLIYYYLSIMFYTFTCINLFKLYEVDTITSTLQLMKQAQGGKFKTSPVIELEMK